MNRKKITVLIAVLAGISFLQAQNVGIGTTTPTSKLNVNGQVTIDQKNFGGYGGLLLKGDVPGNNYPNIAFTIKNNAATPADQVAAMIQGDLQNNAAGAEAIDLTFLNSQSGLTGLTEKMRIKANGNIGIGTAAPGFPLNFASTVGDKISLYGNAGDHYGFGIQGGLLQIHSGTITDDIAFGTGSSNNFTENMRIKGNGNVGIGATTPSAYGHGGTNKILEIKNPNSSAVSQSQLILSTGAADGSMGGITWAQHNIATNPMAAFLGCVLDPFNTGTKMVFYTRNTPANLLTEKMTIDGNGNVGIGTNTPTAKLEIKDGSIRFNNSSTPSASNRINSLDGYLVLRGGDATATGGNGVWINNTGSVIGGTKFQTSGAIEIGGSEGVAGQLLTSNGPGNAATWTNPIVYGTSGATIDLTGTSEILLPTANITLNLTRPSKVILFYRCQTGKTCLVGECSTKWILKCKANGVEYGRYFILATAFAGSIAGSNVDDRTVGPDYVNLSAGTHTLTFTATNDFNAPGISLNIKYSIVPN
jgi:hypothetical protein